MFKIIWYTCILLKCANVCYNIYFIAVNVKVPSEYLAFRYSLPENLTEKPAVVVPGCEDKDVVLPNCSK
jgi:hypothetical protein